mmetsp:Transcript_55590/g.156479  ORF Transcript_55590/g.156479 Transcript_55590/m.156479 type:complete len:241 (+) Transcript_55590:524-1246(+)
MSRTFSVPPRRPASWPPPCSMRLMGVPPRTYSAATPLGAPNLWPTTVIRSAPVSCAFTGTLPKLCAASVCRTTPDSFATLAMSAIGCRDPISLLECMTVISTVFGWIASFTCAAVSRPSASTGTSVYASRPSAASAARHSRMAGCSMVEETTWGVSPARRSRAAATTPTIAWLSDSVPQDVKRISPGSPPRSLASRSLASFTAAAHGRAKAWPLEGLPKWWNRKGLISSATSGKIGEVAL